MSTFKNLQSLKIIKKVRKRPHLLNPKLKSRTIKRKLRNSRNRCLNPRKNLNCLNQSHKRMSQQKRENKEKTNKEEILDRWAKIFKMMQCLSNKCLKLVDSKSTTKWHFKILALYVIWIHSCNAYWTYQNLGTLYNWETRCYATNVECSEKFITCWWLQRLWRRN